MFIQNNHQAARSTGWLSLTAAYTKQAVMSSSSRSGNSSVTIRSGVSPFANNSITSVTLIRKFRTQGLPPH